MNSEAYTSHIDDLLTSQILVPNLRNQRSNEVFGINENVEVTTATDAESLNSFSSPLNSTVKELGEPVSNTAGKKRVLVVPYLDAQTETVCNDDSLMLRQTIHRSSDRWQQQSYLFDGGLGVPLNLHHEDMHRELHHANLQRLLNVNKCMAIYRRGNEIASAQYNFSNRKVKITRAVVSSSVLPGALFILTLCLLHE